MKKININYNYFYGNKDNQNTITKFDFKDEVEIIPIADFQQIYGIERNNND